MSSPDRAVAYGLTEPDNVAEVWSWWSWASCRACGQALGSETQEDLVDYLAEHQARYHCEPLPAAGSGRARLDHFQLELDL